MFVDSASMSRLCAALALALLLLLVLVQGACAEPCPAGCACRWRGGKRAALCAAGELTAPPAALDPATQDLDLAHNRLTSLGAGALAAVGLVNLQRLNLSACHLRSVHGAAFRSLDLLAFLDLSHNELESVEARWFEPTPRLRHLRLDGNRIARLGARSFPPLPHLRTLLVNGCRVAEIDPEAFVGLESSLETLELAGNELRRLSVATVARLPSLARLELARNPWECSCALAALQAWLDRHQVTGAERPACTAPGALAATPWPSAHDDACLAAWSTPGAQLVCEVRGAVRWRHEGGPIALSARAHSAEVSVSAAALVDKELVINVSIQNKTVNRDRADVTRGGDAAGGG